MSDTMTPAEKARARAKRINATLQSMLKNDSQREVLAWLLTGPCRFMHREAGATTELTHLNLGRVAVGHDLMQRLLESNPEDKARVTSLLAQED